MPQSLFYAINNAQRRLEYQQMARSGRKGQRELMKTLNSGRKGILKVSCISDIFAPVKLERNEGFYSLMGIIPVERNKTIVNVAVYMRSEDFDLKERFYDYVEERFART